jgi:hypothetical protein
MSQLLAHRVERAHLDVGWAPAPDMQSTLKYPKTLVGLAKHNVSAAAIATAIAGSELGDLTLAHRSVSLDPSI